MRKIVLLLILIAVSLNSFAQKFTVENANGNILSYKVLSKTDKTVAVIQRKDKLPALVIPSTVEYEGTIYTVTEIAPRACNGKTVTQTVEFPNTLKKIDVAAFSFCSKIKTIHLPEGLISIGEYAFSRCTDLETISIPNSIMSIGKYAFSKDFISEWSAKRTIDDYFFDNLPPYINENNCEDMGISKGSVSAYLAKHPRNVPQQPQIVYVQAPAQQQGPAAQEQPKAPSSDVDLNLPVNPAVNENTFAVIIANENYQEEMKVEYALNDGEMMRQYCNKVLGLPKSQAPAICYLLMERAQCL